MSILVRLALRRDRVMIPAWVLGLGAAVAVTASSYVELYADAASRREVIATLGSTPATLALYGRIYDDSVGALVAWRLGGIALALAGLMSILIVVRHTRAEEETGRAELVGAGVVGRRAPLAAALIVAAIADVALGVVVALAVVATGLGRGGALALGLAFALVGLAFAAVAAVTAQLTESARAANGIAVAVLGGAFGAARDRRRRPALALLAVAARAGASRCARSRTSAGGSAARCSRSLAAVLVAVAVRLAAAPRPRRRASCRRAAGPRAARSASPLALAWRLQRGALAGWAAGFAILGAAFGSIAQDIGDVIGDSPEVLDALRRLGGGRRASSTPTSPRRCRSSR